MDATFGAMKSCCGHHARSGGYGRPVMTPRQLKQTMEGRVAVFQGSMQQVSRMYEPTPTITTCKRPYICFRSSTPAPLHLHSSATSNSSDTEVSHGPAREPTSTAWAVRGEPFRPGSTQDAHEFLGTLLEQVQAEVLRREAAALGSPRVPIGATRCPASRNFGFCVEHQACGCGRSRTWTLAAMPDMPTRCLNVCPT